MKPYLLLLSLFIFSCDNPEEPAEDLNGDYNTSSQVSISIENNANFENIISIMMINNEIVAGVQMDIIGIEIINVFGGLAEENGFEIGFSNLSPTILTFSLSSNTIPASEGILFNIMYENQSEEICISDPIFSDDNGQPMDISNMGFCD